MTAPMVSAAEASSRVSAWSVTRSSICESRLVKVMIEAISPRIVFARNAPIPALTVVGRSVGASGAPPYWAPGAAG